MEFYEKISLGVISILVVAANFFVVCLVCLKRVPRTHTNWLTVSLAMSDILTGGVLLPTVITGLTHVVVDYLISMILLWGVGNICALTYDRYVAVIKPLQYIYRIPEILKKIIVAVWLFPTIYSLLPIFWRKDRSRTIHLVYLVCLEFVGVFIPYFFVTIGYVRIFKEVKQSLALRKNLNFATTRLSQHRNISSDAKVAKLFFIISMVFLISWVPIIYMTTADRIFGRLDIIPEVLPTISLYTIATASLVNPFVYALLKPDFRVITRNMYRKSGRIGAMSMTLQKSSEVKTGGETKSNEDPPKILH